MMARTRIIRRQDCPTVRGASRYAVALYGLKVLHMRIQEKKIFISVFLIITLAMLLVAMSLSNMVLRAGTPFPSGNGQGDQPHSPDGERGQLPNEFFNSFFKGIVALILLVSSIYVFANFIIRLNLKILIRGVIAILILIVLLIIFPSTPIAQPRPETIDLNNPDFLSVPSLAVSPLGEPPQAWRWIVLGILISVVLALVILYFMRRTKSKPPQDRILHEAEEAAAAIRRGDDFQSVILRCYQQMSGILRDERGIDRDESMTARQFMELLVDRGISPPPIRKLTLLFEAARYGTSIPSEQDEQISLNCLDQIIKDCRKGD
jgi:hypothetical protein